MRAVAGLMTRRSPISALDRPRADERDDLRLALGELVEPAGRRDGGGRAGGEGLHHAPRDRRREQRLALGHDAHSAHDVLGVGVLEQEAGRARAQRLEDILVDLEGREDDDLDAGQLGLGHDPARGLQPVESPACGCP